MLKLPKRSLSAAIALIVAAPTMAQEAANELHLEETLVLAKKTAFANSLVSEGMINQQTPLTSVLSVIDNLPGVLINEGDTFGSDDWSTTISMRGFQVSLDEQQIGMTVDGIPNGDSNYGGGSKANRFIDTENLASVEVSQGTADIASRSHEALGGTLNFITQTPEEEQRMRFSISSGDYQARKVFVRFDTGEIFGNTSAYISMSTSDNKAWIDESGESSREHYAVKFVSDFDSMEMTGYLSYDEIHEDNYQRVTLEEFTQNPDWDRLTGDWSGIPLVDQMYRRGWSTLRENTLGYLKFDFDFDSIHLNVTPYFHINEGRGDWLPPYIVDVVDDGDGEPHSELVSGTSIDGGKRIGTFTYVNREGASLTPVSDQCSSLTFPYGGSRNDDPDTEDDESSNLDKDPACFPNTAIPVGSYRHTHYGKSRWGINADMDWRVDLSFGENLLRGGIWYEDRTREESRNWHKVIDSRSGYQFDRTAYWNQYDREYPQETIMYYIEDSLTAGMFTATLGGKQWFVDTERVDNFNSNASGSVSSDSDLLINAGLLADFTDSLEGFVGYAENYASIKDVVLEAANLADNPEALDGIEPETAENMDIGLRYTGERFNATFTYYDINFENRITYIPSGGVEGIDYLGELDGQYINVGGISSDGIEASATWFASQALTVYLSYTLNDSTYNQGFIRSDEEIPEGNTVAGSAEDMLVLSLDWNQDIYSAGISSKYVGERWLDFANEDRLDAYNVTDIYASVSGEAAGSLQGYEIRFTINNLFNEDYIGGVAGGWGGWIGSGRTAAVNLVLDF